VFCVYGLGVSPVPDPLNVSAGHRREVEERLEDFAVWYAVCRPSGRQASYKSIGKYISSVVPQILFCGARAGGEGVAHSGYPERLWAGGRPTAAYGAYRVRAR
jgi:hypothetical protein